MNLAHNAQKMGNACVFFFSKFSLKCEENLKNRILIIRCLFPIGRVGTNRQALHLFKLYVGSYKHGDILYHYYRLGENPVWPTSIPISYLHLVGG